MWQEKESMEAWAVWLRNVHDMQRQETNIFIQSKRNYNKIRIHKISKAGANLNPWIRLHSFLTLSFFPKSPTTQRKKRDSVK